MRGYLAILHGKNLMLPIHSILVKDLRETLTTAWNTSIQVLNKIYLDI